MTSTIRALDMFPKIPEEFLQGRKQAREGQMRGGGGLGRGIRGGQMFCRYNGGFYDFLVAVDDIGR